MLKILQKNANSLLSTLVLTMKPKFSPKSTDGHSYKANAQQLEKNVLCNFRHISQSAVRAKAATAEAKIFQTNTCQQFFNSPNGQ